MATEKFSAIKTNYKGVELKSRMEAQCAVLFDKLGWRWEYERFSFMLPSGIGYLPDFWLPDPWLLVECRGYKSDRADRQLREFGSLIDSAEFELPDDEGTLGEYLVIGPDQITRYCRSRSGVIKSGDPIRCIFAQCDGCGTYHLVNGASAYCECDCCDDRKGLFPSWSKAYALTVRDGKLLLNGKNIEDCDL